MKEKLTGTLLSVQVRVPRAKLIGIPPSRARHSPLGNWVMVPLLFSSMKIEVRLPAPSALKRRPWQPAPFTRSLNKKRNPCSAKRQ